MGRSKKSKAGSQMEALAEALDALSARPLEVVIRLPGPVPEGTRLERRLINTVLATDKRTVIKIYREEPVGDNASLAAANSRADNEGPRRSGRSAITKSISTQ
jgi:hypothetical protein